MLTVFLIFALSDLALMAIATGLGFTVVDDAYFARHFLLGLMTGLYTCFVHIVTFMYFVVCEKIIRQAVLSGQLTPEAQITATTLKSRAVRASLSGIASILLVIGFGGAIGTYVSPSIHRDTAFASLAINAAAFAWQFSLIRRNRRHFDAAFERATIETESVVSSRSA